jgi:hypothetical protein
MNFMSQMLDYFRSPAIKESLYKALANQDCTLEKDKLLPEMDGYTADLYIETDDVIYLVKTVEKFSIEPLSGDDVEDLWQAKKRLVQHVYKQVVPIMIIGQNTQGHSFMEAAYRHHVLVIQGPIEDCATHLEFILQHQVVPTYQMSMQIRDSDMLFFAI